MKTAAASALMFTLSTSSHILHADTLPNQYCYCSDSDLIPHLYSVVISNMGVGVCLSQISSYNHMITMALSQTWGEQWPCLKG